MAIFLQIGGGKLKRFIFTIDDVLLDKLKEVASKKGLSIAGLIRMILTEYVAREGSKPPVLRNKHVE